ncbi:hypothetical protein [Rhodoferax sp.]|uniref:hypothetical protein n=1 Tax=Rhodoferax sp. TaxID=50421 RepID=UPI00272056FD|nr:hypothetical protein [Rhodoferax sp.]MDO8321005.1 hypothetical protein [Rhodoferax sp.]
MSESTAPLVSDIPLFDVFIALPPQVEVEQLTLHETSLTPQQIETLSNALRKAPKVKIGAAVASERCEHAKVQFANSGLVLSIVPLLALQAVRPGSLSEHFTCPACNQQVVLPENRQCPACGVFVDKVDEAFLLKRKILQQERAKIEMQAARETSEAEKNTRRALEDALRAKIREELEAEYGLARKGMFQGKAGLMRATGILAVVAGAFVGGQNLPMQNLPWADKASQSASADNVDKMLSTGLGASAASDSSGASGDAPTGKTGDPDIDNDPMMQAIGGHRVGAKGISMEQALGAATVLAKSVGNTTAQRALAGGAGGGGPAAATAFGTAVGAAPAAATAGGAAAATEVPAAIKLTMEAEFASTLAELGQLPRARAALDTVKARPTLASEPQAAQAVRLADLEIRAWALQSLPEGKARNAADKLRALAEAISDPAERTLALSRAGVILSQQTQLAPEVSHAFLALAANAVKTVADTNQRSLLVGEWMVAMGHVLLAEASTHASAGRWAKVQKSASALANLMEQAPNDTTLFKFHALNFRMQQLLGQGSKADQSLKTALSLAANFSKFAERGEALRSTAQLAGHEAQAAIAPAVNALMAQLDSASGPDKAQALVQLALLQAQAGAQEAADRLSQQAESVNGLTAMERLEVKSDLIVRTDLAMAKALHQSGALAQAENLLQRISDYLY